METTRICFLILVASVALTSAARAGPITDQWSAEATQSREGRTFRTVVTFTYDGKVSNERALWLVDVRCEVRSPGSSEVSTVTGSGTAMLAQGGNAPPLGDVYVIKAVNELPGGKGKLEVHNPNCASGIPTIRQGLHKAAMALPKVEPSDTAAKAPQAPRRPVHRVTHPPGARGCTTEAWCSPTPRRA